MLSPSLYNRKSGLAVFVPVTNQVKGYPFEVVLPGGLTVTGAALADQIRSLEWHARNTALICRLPPETTREILRKAGVLLSLAG